MNKKIFPIIISLLIVLWLISYIGYSPSTFFLDKSFPEESKVAINNPQLLVAYHNRLTKIQVEGEGLITKVLKDDLEGIRHQRLLVKVNNQQTILITHNINLAIRIANPQIGQLVKFKGEYIWNKKGGVIHWTHKDPRGKHDPGWLIYQNKYYQ